MSRLLGTLHDGRPVYEDSGRELRAALEYGHGRWIDTENNGHAAELSDDDPGSQEPHDVDDHHVGDVDDHHVGEWHGDDGGTNTQISDSEAEDSDDDGLPRLWNAVDLEAARQPEWLARRRLPRAAVSLLCGDEGIGKSLFWVWVVAAITTGTALPEFGIPARDPARVILVITEDAWTFDVLPRLEVAGADISMIQVICTDRDGSGSPMFPRDLYLIADADPVPAMVVVDAWLDTVPATYRVRDPQDARRALHPWKEVASTTGAAVLLLCHTNRLATGDTRNKYGTTYALRQKVRMALYAIQDDGGNLVLGPDKANGVVTEAASVFTIKGIQKFDPTEDHDGTVPLLAHLYESDRTIKQHVLGAFDSERGDDDDVDAWLTAFLKEGDEGKQKATEVFKATDAAGFSKDKAKRAKQRLGVMSVRPGGDGPWFWQMPLPVCEVCGEPVAVGQGETHLGCRESE